MCFDAGDAGEAAAAAGAGDPGVTGLPGVTGGVGDGDARSASAELLVIMAVRASVLASFFMMNCTIWPTVSALPSA